MQCICRPNSNWWQLCKLLDRSFELLIYSSTGIVVRRWSRSHCHDPLYVCLACGTLSQPAKLHSFWIPLKYAWRYIGYVHCVNRPKLVRSLLCCEGNLLCVQHICIGSFGVVVPYNRTNTHHCLYPGSRLNRWVNWINVEFKKLADRFNTTAQDSNPGSLSRETEATTPRQLLLINYTIVISNTLKHWRRCNRNCC